jgi:quercetin dioxygenase-like cupin family protein
MSPEHSSSKSHESREKLVTDLEMSLDPASPESMFVDLEKFQLVSSDQPTVALVYAPSGNSLGVVVWNLGPGQQNERHMHPAIDHLHIVLTGEAEYRLADAPPITVRAGQAVMVPAKVVHGIRNNGTMPCSYVAVTTPGNYEKVLEEN